MSDYNKIIDLELTQLSGQTSQPPWKQENDEYREVVIVEGVPVLFKAHELNKSIEFSYEFPLNSDFHIKKSILDKKASEIFDLDFNLSKFYKYLNQDEKLAEMTSFCDGLRLFLAKDKFESILSSICSANNSIARWTKSIDLIKQKWGKSFEFPSGTFYGVPSLDAIINSFEDDQDEFDNCDFSDISLCENNLKACGVGYRASYMKKASEILSLEMDFGEISKMSYDEAFDTILKLPGVGPKVADCILLYGFNFREAFPSDVWIKRIVSHLYFEGKDIKVPKIREFGMEEFGDYAGYVQLYLFHYARRSGLMNELKK